MSRSIVLSNGSLGVALDSHGQVRDIYYPYIGLEDHVRGHYTHRVGVWVEGRLSWLSDDPAWKITVSSETEALASAIVAVHPELKVELVFKDIVYNERPIFVRRISVANKADRNREIKLYFAHQFEIYKSHGSDTAYFDPRAHALIHYKGRRVFLIGAQLDGSPFSDYATGRANFQGREGTHKDAEDGALSKNAIEHGPADSVLGLYASYAPEQSRVAYYWLAAAQTIPESHELNAYVAKKSPEHLVKTATNFWHAWVGIVDREFPKMTPEQVVLFKRSLMYMRAAVDEGGGIIASLDSDMLQYGLDTYSYVWPRDGAYTALALDRAGDTNIARRFFEFCRDVIEEDGYFMHKYLPDKSLGSSWHPWVLGGIAQLPIQEDETALVICALKEHYYFSRDIELLEEMYNPLVERAADFLLRYRDEHTKLPLPSYDLWERKRGSSTFTCAAVYGALLAAAELSRVLGKDTHEERYRRAAHEIREAVLKHLWDEKAGIFINMLSMSGEQTAQDHTIDISSVYGVFSFGILEPNDPRLARAFEGTVRALSHGIIAGGIARFERDDYYQIDAATPGNPWVITTLWYAEYLIAKAQRESDLARVRDIFTWVVRHAQPSGVLSEQLHPHTGEQVGAAPLTWTHAAYVTAVLKYIEKYHELSR